MSLLTFEQCSTAVQKIGPRKYLKMIKQEIEHFSILKRGKVIGNRRPFNRRPFNNCKLKEMNFKYSGFCFQEESLPPAPELIDLGEFGYPNGRGPGGSSGGGGGGSFGILEPGAAGAAGAYPNMVPQVNDDKQPLKVTARFVV